MNAKLAVLRQAPGRVKPYRYLIFSMVILMAVINYIDRGAISYAAEPIIKEFGFSTSDWGAVLGYFGYGYMVGAVIGGTLADRKGPKWMWIVAAVSWSVVEILMIFAGQIGVALIGGSALAGFAVFRVLFGLAEGPVFSTINRTMANWAAPSERGFAASLGLLGTPLGALLTAPVAVGILTLTGSWRTLFIILGVAGLVWVFFWVRMFRNMPEDHPKVSEYELAEIRRHDALVKGEQQITGNDEVEPWWHFFKNSTLLFNVVGYFSFQYVNFMILTWTPKYLQDEFGFKLSSLWYLGMVPWVGACFTVLLGGKIMDYLRRRTGSLFVSRSVFAAASLLLTTICFSTIPLMHSAVSVLIVMAIGNALNSLPNAVYWTVVIDEAPTRAGTFGGLSAFFVNAASILAPTLTGFLVAQHGYGAMFVATAIATGMGMVAMVFVRPGQRARRKIEAEKRFLESESPVNDNSEN